MFFDIDYLFPVDHFFYKFLDLGSLCIIFQNHPKYECLPTLPEDSNSEENLGDLPSASSPRDQEGEGNSPFDQENEFSTSRKRNKEGRVKQSMDVDAQDLPPAVEGAGDSTSAALTSSKAQDVPASRPSPQISMETDRPVNSLGVPLMTS